MNLFTEREVRLAEIVGEEVGEMLKSLRGRIAALEAEIEAIRHSRKGKWLAGSRYKAGEEVCWHGSSWRAARDTATEPPSADWYLSANGWPK